MSFQNIVTQQPAVGIEGGRASDNPISAVVGSFVANSAGVRVGSFAWGSGNTAYSFVLGNTAPAGFVANNQNAYITTWKGSKSMLIPAGAPVTMHDRGDFWAYSTYADASVGQKVFANVFNGKILPAAAGSFPALPAGTTGTITASFATNVMTPTAGSIYLAVGMLITGTGVPANTYIEAQLTGSAGACTSATYQLTTYPGTVASSAAVVATSPDGIGGATCSSVSSSSSTTMTINTLTNGSIVVGSLVQGITSVPAGTYVASIGTFNGTSGTVILSAATTGTITAQACTFSAWVETPFYVKSAGNLGDLIKIGVKN